MLALRSDLWKRGASAALPRLFPYSSLANLMHMPKLYHNLGACGYSGPAGAQHHGLYRSGGLQSAISTPTIKKRSSAFVGECHSSPAPSPPCSAMCADGCTSPDLQPRLCHIIHYFRPSFTNLSAIIENSARYILTNQLPLYSQRITIYIHINVVR